MYIKAPKEFGKAHKNSRLLFWYQGLWASYNISHTPNLYKECIKVFGGKKESPCQYFEDELYKNNHTCFLHSIYLFSLYTSSIHWYNLKRKNKETKSYQNCPSVNTMILYDILQSYREYLTAQSYVLSCAKIHNRPLGSNWDILFEEKKESMCSHSNEAPLISQWWPIQ